MKEKILDMVSGKCTGVNCPMQIGKVDPQNCLAAGDCPWETKPVTNADRIRAMSDEELAEYLFNRGNCSEYCYGICAYQDECDGSDHAQEFCIGQIVKWLKQEAKYD